MTVVLRSKPASESPVRLACHPLPPLRVSDAIGLGWTSESALLQVRGDAGTAGQDHTLRITGLYYLGCYLGGWT